MADRELCLGFFESVAQTKCCSSENYFLGPRVSGHLCDKKVVISEGTEGGSKGIRHWHQSSAGKATGGINYNWWGNSYGKQKRNDFVSRW